MARVFLFVNQNMFVHHLHPPSKKKNPKKTKPKKTKRRKVLLKEDRVLLEFLKESGFSMRSSKRGGRTDWRAAVWLSVG